MADKLKTANQRYRDGDYAGALRLYREIEKETPQFARFIAQNIRLAELKSAAAPAPPAAPAGKAAAPPAAPAAKSAAGPAPAGQAAVRVLAVFIDCPAGKDDVAKINRSIRRAMGGESCVLSTAGLFAVRSGADFRQLFDSRAAAYNFCYAAPFEVSFCFWLNQILMRHDVDAMLVFNKATPGEIEKHLAGRKNLPAGVLFDCAVSPGEAADGDCLRYAGIAAPLLRQHVGYFSICRGGLAFADYAARTALLLGEGALGPGAAGLLPPAQGGGHALLETRDALLGTLRPVHAVEPGRLHRPAVPAPEYMALLPDELLPSNLGLVYGMDLPGKPADPAGAPVYFTFDTYLERCGLPPGAAREAFHLHGLGGPRAAEVAVLSNAPAPGGGAIPALRAEGETLLFADLLPLSLAQGLDVGALQSSGKVPLLPLLPRITALEGGDPRACIDTMRGEERAVSVVCSVFNMAPTVAWSVFSLLQQSHRDVEMVFVDDDSRDESLEALVRFLGLYPYARHKVVSLPENLGAYVARNVGILEAAGHYVTSHDLDDFSTPQRLFMSRYACARDGARMATLSHSRMSAGGNVMALANGVQGADAINRLCYVSLFYERSAVGELGLFEPVRRGGDSEFIERAKAALGAGAVASLKVNCYYALMEQPAAGRERLTADLFSQAGHLNEHQFELVESKERQSYTRDFRKRHAARAGGAPARPRYAKHPGLAKAKVVCNVATIPRRAAQFEAMLESIIPQVDALNVFLNGFDEIPANLREAFARHRGKLKIHRSQETGDLRDNAKFYYLGRGPTQSYYLTVDDDIAYPYDYVDRLLYKSQAHDDRYILCVHGYCLWPDVKSVHTDVAKKSRQYHFKFAVPHDILVDVPGTGTVLIPPGMDLPNFNDGPFGFVDILFAEMAKRLRIPVLTVARPAGWLAAIGQGGADGEEEGGSLFQENQNPEREALIARHLPPPREHVAATPPPGAPPGPPPAPLKSFYSARADDFHYRAALGRIYVCATGFNYADYATAFLSSLWGALKSTNHHAVTVLLLDDGSTDGSHKRLVRYAERNLSQWDVRIFRAKENHGPAFARAFLLEQILPEDAPCLFLDMDDEAAPGLVRRVAAEYACRAGVKMTLGSWMFNDVVRRPWPSFSQADVDGPAHLRPPFKFGHTRSFASGLFAAAHKDLLLGPDGRWLKYCSDVGLLLAILDQLRPGEIRRVDEVFYKYNLNTGHGTIRKYGASKAATRTWLYLCAHEYFKMRRLAGRAADARYRAAMDRDAAGVQLLYSTR